MPSPILGTTEGLVTQDMDVVEVPPVAFEMTRNKNQIRPTDSDESRLRERVCRAAEILVPVYGLNRWTIKVFYQRMHFDGQYKDASMYIVTQWEYQLADIHVSIDACYDDEWDDVLFKIAHELAHTLTEPLLDHAPDTSNKHVKNANELLVTSIASSVLYALMADNPEDPCREEA